MEEKKIFEGLIEEAKRVTKEHSEADIMIIMSNKVLNGNYGFYLDGMKETLIAHIVLMMDEDEDLRDIIMTSLLLYEMDKK